MLTGNVQLSLKTKDVLFTILKSVCFQNLLETYISEHTAKPNLPLSLYIRAQYAEIFLYS